MARGASDVESEARYSAYRVSGKSCASAQSSMPCISGQQLWCRAGRSPLGLDALALLVEILQQLVVVLVEAVARHRRQAGVDVSRAGGVLATLQAGTKLPCTGGQVHSSAGCKAVSFVSAAHAERDTKKSRCLVRAVPPGCSRLMLLLPTKF